MCSNERKLEWKWVTVMNPFDPYHHQRTEYWADKVMEQSRTGYSTGHLRAADALWHIMETSVKIVTFPIWWPISWWNKRKKRKSQPQDPYTTDLNRPLYK